MVIFTSLQQYFTLGTQGPASAPLLSFGYVHQTSLENIHIHLPSRTMRFTPFFKKHQLFFNMFPCMPNHAVEPVHIRLYEALVERRRYHHWTARSALLIDEKIRCWSTVWSHLSFPFFSHIKSCWC